MLQLFIFRGYGQAECTDEDAYRDDDIEREQMLEVPGYILLRLQHLYTEQDSSTYHLIVRVLSGQ